MPVDLSLRTAGVPLVCVVLLVLRRRRSSVIGFAIGLLIPLAVIGVCLAAFALECAHSQCFTL